MGCEVENSSSFQGKHFGVGVFLLINIVHIWDLEYVLLFLVTLI